LFEPWHAASCQCHNTTLTSPFPSPVLLLVSIKRTLFINMMYGAAMPGIDNAAHVGGFLSGAAVSYLFGPRLLLEKRNGRTVRIDRPMIDWGKGWRRFMKSGFGGVGGDRDGEEMRRRPARDPMTED
jgi:hypothetical protein